MEELQQMLLKNGCEMDDFLRTAHLTMLLFLLEQLCRGMKRDPALRSRVLRIYHRTRDNVQAAHDIANKLCGVDLPEADSAWLDRCLRAHFQKQSRRKPVAAGVRAALLQKQAGRCACCGEELGPDNHYDHIIPWEWVGDELADNAQLLCGPCNEHKSGCVYYMLKSQLLKKTV